MPTRDVPSDKPVSTGEPARGEMPRRATVTDGPASPVVDEHVLPDPTTRPETDPYSAGCEERGAPVKSPSPAMTALPPEVMAKHMESAMAKLRNLAARSHEHAHTTWFTGAESAALLAKLEAAERLLRAAEDARLYVEGWKEHRPGWNGNWFDAKNELEAAIASYRTPQQEPSNG